MWVVCLFITSTHTYKRKSWFLLWTVMTRAGYPSTEIPESKVWIRLDDSISQHVGFDHVSKHDWEKDAGWAPLTSTNRASSTLHCKFIKAPPQKPVVLPKRKAGSNSAVTQVYSFSLHLTKSIQASGEFILSLTKEAFLLGNIDFPYLNYCESLNVKSFPDVSLMKTWRWVRKNRQGQRSKLLPLFHFH